MSTKYFEAEVIQFLADPLEQTKQVTGNPVSYPLLTSTSLAHFRDEEISKYEAHVRYDRVKEKFEKLVNKVSPSEGILMSKGG